MPLLFALDHCKITSWQLNGYVPSYPSR
uniref:Uncharacterized protein n=1 Tax=Anguilla anguilla TaxID=7936 RepID=A0A0E9P664_ANGAN